MELLERQDFTVTQDESGSEKLNLEGRGFKHTLTPKAYSFLQACGLKEKTTGLTAPALAPGSRPGIGVSTGEIPVGQPVAITGRHGNVNNIQGEERLPSDLGRFFQVPQTRRPAMSGNAPPTYYWWAIRAASEDDLQRAISLIKQSDPAMELDPECNSVTAWCLTRLTDVELEALDCGLDVVFSLKNQGR